MNAPVQVNHGRVFISYRREETAFAAGWLYDVLAEHFGKEQIFKDIDSIQLGDNWFKAITDAVGSCEVLLALIGERWLTVTDEAGRRRLDSQEDWVRVEIETALERDISVIPIVVEGAQLPRPDQLPPTLVRLVQRQALEISPRGFSACAPSCRSRSIRRSLAAESSTRWARDCSSSRTRWTLSCWRR